MIKICLAILTMGVIGITIALPAQAENYVVLPKFDVQNAYAYATAPSQKNGAVFLTLKNNGDMSLRLTHVSGADIANKIELHTHLMDGDTMQMREVEGFDIPPHKALTLSPMGDHIMLMGLKAPLKVAPNMDGTFSLKLHFAGGSVRNVQVQIVPPGTQPVQDPHAMHENHKPADHSPDMHDHNGHH